MKTALQLKEQGNALYRAFRFAEAETAYTKGLALMTNTTCGDTRMTQAVLHSNRGNSRMERGDYAGSIEDSQAALQLLLELPSDVKTETLGAKNKWRLARALFYNNNDHALTQLVTENADDEKFRKTTTAFLNRPIDGKRPSFEFEPQLMRTKFTSPSCEYYTFGHDIAASAFRKDQNVSWADSSVRLKDLGPGFHFNVLYGGVGDGRHVMATIMDAHRQWEDDGRDDQHVHITMNDINIQVLVKDILVLIISQRIACLTKDDMEMVFDEEEPYFLGVVLYYATLGTAMPAYVYNKLQSLVREIFLEPSFAVFCETHSWLRVAESDWTEFVRVASHWADTTKYKHPLPSVQTVLETHYPPPLDRNFEDNAGAAMRQQQSLLKREAREARQACKKEFLDRSTWPSHFLEDVLRNTGENATEEEQMRVALKLVDDIPDYHLLVLEPDQASALVMDRRFLDIVHGLLPPRPGSPVPQLEMETNFATTVNENSPSDQAIRDHRRFVHETWKVNPVYHDPDWISLVGITLDRDTKNVVTEWISMFFNATTRQTFSQPPMMEFTFFEDNTLLDCFLYFNWNLGTALSKLAGDSSLTIEVTNGSVLDFGTTVQMNSAARQDNGLPTEYMKIFLSNVPDYTGMLSCFTQLSPLLKTKCSVITPALTSNVLLNTGIWKSFDQYVYGTLGLTAKEAARYLHIRVLNDEPDVWNPANRWGKDSSAALANPVGPNELKMWLHRLYMMTVLPPDRDCDEGIREELPNTTDLFLRTCVFCVEVLHYPLHWVTAVLDELLQASSFRPLKTTTTLPNTSPCSIETADRTSKQYTYNLSAFRPELENQVSMWVQKGLLPDRILAVGDLPTKKPIHYCINIKDLMSISGFLACACIGLLLEKHPDPNFDDGGEFKRRVAAMMGQGVVEKSKLRCALLSGGDRVGHVFSCVAADARDKSVSFWMCEDMFEKYKTYYVSVIRTDGWFRSGHAKVRLGNAVPL